MVPKHGKKKPLGHAIGSNLLTQLSKCQILKKQFSAGRLVGQPAGWPAGQSVSWLVNHRTLYTNTAQILGMFNVTVM